jgi:hypothetical protein
MGRLAPAPFYYWSPYDLDAYMLPLRASSEETTFVVEFDLSGLWVGLG